MSYLVVNLTSYGTGAYPIGTFKSRKRAIALADQLNKILEAGRDRGEDHGEGISVLKLEPLDGFTDRSILDYAKDFINGKAKN